MTDRFTRVVFDPTQKEIAAVNRADGTLYLKPQIWDNLPQGEKDFVLLHEKGHLVLQTTDEYKANAYAVKNFAPAHVLSNPELKARITVMQSILTPGRENISGFSDDTSSDTSSDTPSDSSGPWGGFGMISSIAGAVGGIFQTLPLLGLGKAAREEEALKKGQIQLDLINAQGSAQKKLTESKTQSYVIIIVIASAFIVAGIVTYFTLKKK